MAVSIVKLESRQEIAYGTMAFHFEKPRGFVYKAGQSGDFTLINPPETGVEGNTRAFTLASAPYETSIMVATRMRDTAFKRVLKTMELGSEITMDASFGSFTLHSDDTIPAVFLAGGIGVTPMRSMILQATHDKRRHKIVLLYSNRSPEDAPFLDDLTRAQQENPNFTLVATMTEMERSSRKWSGETGFINEAMLTKAVPDLGRPIFYLSGPRGMVAAMRTMLENAGVKDDKIRTEEFSGY